ncbi:MAG: hypothetical protein QM765_44465 [Myxococcales bacterium]
MGRFSLAATFKVGTYSGDGNITLLNSSGATKDVDFDLSAKQIDVGLPISARFGALTAYSGVALIKSWVRGTADGAPVSDIATDIVLNLGARFPIYGTLDLDTEIALVKLGDRFSQSSQMLPYYGLGVGAVF